jgi:endonuclease YncB( thermonuclease family)
VFFTTETRVYFNRACYNVAHLLQVEYYLVIDGGGVVATKHSHALKLMQGEVRGNMWQGWIKSHVDLSFCVASVFDGDTFEYYAPGGRRVRVRLWGMDAPEHGQPGFRRARRYLRELLTAGPFHILECGPDKYGRTLAKVTDVHSQDVSLAMVAAGWAWWYRGYCPHAWDLMRAQAAAQASALGIWQEPRPCPPWIFRHSRGKEHRKLTAGKTSEKTLEVSSKRPVWTPAIRGVVWHTTGGRTLPNA